MPATDRRGFISLKGLLVVGLLVGAGLYLGDLRDWGQRAVDSNTARSQEFDRRVKGQRHAAIKPELERIGVHIETAPAPADSTVFDAGARADRPSLLDRLQAFWYRIRGGTPETVEEPKIPILRDSLGLLPGERMFLPNGRVVEYDSTTFTYQRPGAKQ